MPMTAGPTAAPATAGATCDSATGQNDCEIRIIDDATTAASPETMTRRRLWRLPSTQAPAGAVIRTPAIEPIVITDPIEPFNQPCASRKTPTKGPMPDCMSAMKKLSARKEPFARAVTSALATLLLNQVQGRHRRISRHGGAVRQA